MASRSDVEGGGRSMPATWWEKIREVGAVEGKGVFGAVFLATYGDRIWDPTDDDRGAARSLHVELISRVATQGLGYSEGVEQQALTSVYELFKRSREITEQYAWSATFETFVWYALNHHVRPFLSTWHARSVSGGLRALDSTDYFRAELQRVQAVLIELDGVLQAIVGSSGYLVTAPAAGPDRGAIQREMLQPVGWRHMGLQGNNPLALKERECVEARRTAFGIANPKRCWATGIALSGGGIRSATFSLGVLVSLAKRNLLRQLDYMSTVSGGGYTGCFLTQLLSELETGVGFGLANTELPFARKEGESDLLKSIRQRASYLSGSFWERLGVGTAQAYGVFVNILILTLLAGAIASAELLLRKIASNLHGEDIPSLDPVIILVGAGAVLLAGVFASRSQSAVPKVVLGAGALFIVTWFVLGHLHAGMHYVLPQEGKNAVGRASLAFIALAATSAAAGVGLARYSKIRPYLLWALTMMLLLCIEILVYRILEVFEERMGLILIAGTAIALALWLVVDVNRTSLHHYYRTKLAAAFLIQPDGNSATPMRLSAFKPERSPFPIINCSLNAPASTNAAMRGRKCDLFSLTPVAAGAIQALNGYQPIGEWESANPTFDLASAMALSGAAVSPQMGLRTTNSASFWLTLLNVRLDLWLRRPGKGRGGPGIQHLFRELMATADEKGALINVSDGGHIENLGVYELLRRRCRFIMAIDGESDPRMTFHALTNLQRLAYIDMGIIIEIDPDRLRLDNAGLSRSHFQFCRILYPVGEHDRKEEIGYLTYLKLSLTGNEGEFIRRYKLDEPSFPHHSTADQFFTETQFEAYRALGEHVGEKLFLAAIVGTMGPNVDLEDWFMKLGQSFLQDRAMEG